MAATGTVSLVFTVTVDGSTRTNSEVYLAVLFYYLSDYF